MTAALPAIDRRDFALLMAQDGASCKIYPNSSNTLQGNKTLDEAEISGRPYCAQFKCGYMAVDIDKGNTLNDLSRVLTELREQGKKPVPCLSGGKAGDNPRYHVWFVEPDPDERERYAEVFKGLTVRGRFQSDLMRLPLGSHRLGGMVEIMGMSVDEAYDALQLPPDVVEGDWRLSKAEREKRNKTRKKRSKTGVKLHRQPPATVAPTKKEADNIQVFLERLTRDTNDRSKAIFAAMGLAQYMGLTKTQALQAALSVNTGAAAKAYENGRDPEAYFENAWDKAWMDRETMTHQQRVEEWVYEALTVTDIPARNRLIVHAIGMMAFEGRGPVVGLSLREIEGRTGRSIRTVVGVLDKLNKSGLIKRAGARKKWTDCQNYKLKLRKTRKLDTHNGKRRRDVLVMCVKDARFDDAFLDAFNGKPGARAVYEVLTDEPQTTKKIAQKTKTTASTVRKHLEWLVEHELAAPSPKRTWVIGKASLAEVALRRGSTGKAQRRRDQFDKERERHRQAEEFRSRKTA